MADPGETGAQGAQGTTVGVTGGAEGDGSKLVAPIKPADSIAGSNKGGCDNSVNDDCSGSSLNYNIDRDLLVETAQIDGDTKRYVSLNSSSNQEVDQNARGGSENGSTQNIIYHLTNARRPLQFESHSTLKRLPVRQVNDGEHGDIGFNSYSYLEAGITYDSGGYESCARNSNFTTAAVNKGMLSYNTLFHYVLKGPPFVLGSVHQQVFSAQDLPENNTEVLRNDGFCFIAKLAPDQAGEYGTVFFKFGYHENQDKITKYVINNRMWTMSSNDFGKTTASGYVSNDIYGSVLLRGWPGITLTSQGEVNPYVVSHIISGRLFGMNNWGYQGAANTFAIDSSSDYNAWDKANTAGNLLNISLYDWASTPAHWKTQLGGGSTAGAAHYASNYLHRQLFREGIYHNSSNSSLNQPRYGPRLIEHGVNGTFGNVLRNPHYNKDYFPNFNVFDRSNQSLDFHENYRDWNPSTTSASINWQTGFNNLWNIGSSSEGGIADNCLWYEPYEDGSGGRFFKSPDMSNGEIFNEDYFVSNQIRADFSWRPFTIIIYKGTVNYNIITGQLSGFSNDYVEYGRYRTFNTSSRSGSSTYLGSNVANAVDGAQRFLYRTFGYPPQKRVTDANGTTLELFTTELGDDNYIKVNFADHHSSEYEEISDLKVMIFQDVSSIRKDKDNSNKPLGGQNEPTPDEWTVSFKHPSDSGTIFPNLPLFYPKYNETYQLLRSQTVFGDHVSYVRGYINTYTEDSWHAHTIFKGQSYTVDASWTQADQNASENGKFIMPPIPWDITLKTTKRGELDGVLVNKDFCPSDRSSFHGYAGGSPQYCGECKGFSPLRGTDSYYDYGNLLINSATFFNSDDQQRNYTPYAIGYPWPDVWNDHRSYTLTYDNDGENITMNPSNTD